MKKITLSTSFALAAVLALSVQAAAESKPSANVILRQMSDTLRAAHQFSFSATRKIDAGVAASRGLQSDAKIEVYVRRPNAVFATSTSSDTVRSLYFDGKNFTMLDGKENMYATVSLPGTLDNLPTQLAVKFGIVPPLADFVTSNPYRDFRWRAQKIAYAGTTSCPSGSSAGSPDKCYRITLSGKFADSELWIADSDHLPRKMTATLKGAAADPTLSIEFSDWNLTASFTDDKFVFTPPKDAMKIDMITTAEAQAADKASSDSKVKPTPR